jgi:hypothetical protein
MRRHFLALLRKCQKALKNAVVWLISGAGLSRISSSLSHHTSHDYHQRLICSISVSFPLSFVLSRQREIVSWMSISGEYKVQSHVQKRFSQAYGPRCGDELVLDLVLPVWSAVNHFSFGTQLKQPFASYV